MCGKLLAVAILLCSALSYGQDIFSAARSGDLDRIRELTRINADTVNSISPSGFQPLMIACYRGQTDAAKLLLASGAQVNAMSPEGDALLAASYQGNAELIEVLLQAGAKGNTQGPDGNTALMYAILMQRPDLVKLLIPYSDLTLANKDNQTALSLAKALENREILQMVETALNN